MRGKSITHLKTAGSVDQTTTRGASGFHPWNGVTVPCVCWNVMNEPLCHQKNFKKIGASQQETSTLMPRSAAGPIVIMAIFRSLPNSPMTSG
jgi:hypothetical protein